MWTRKSPEMSVIQRQNFTVKKEEEFKQKKVVAVLLKHVK